MYRRVALETIENRFRELQSGLTAQTEALSPRQTGFYFAGLGDLLFELSRHPLTAQQALPFVRQVHKVFEGIVNRAGSRNSRLKRFLNLGHGFAKMLPSLGFSGFPKAHSKRQVQQMLLYNAVHWSGVGELLGHTTSRRIRVTPSLLKRLVSSTPHLVDSEMGKHIAVSVTGESVLSPGQLFVVLRSASNSLHSLKLNAIFRRFSQRLSDPQGLRGALVQVSSRRYWRASLRKTNGWNTQKADSYIDRMWNRTQHEGQIGIRIAPSQREQVWKELQNEDWHNLSLPHYGVVAKAAGLPDYAAYEFENQIRRGSGVERVQQAMDQASEKESLDIHLEKDSATVMDSGLGKVYQNVFSQDRFLGGTSGYLQRRAARITRRFEGPQTRTVLRFKKVV